MASVGILTLPAYKQTVLNDVSTVEKSQLCNSVPIMGCGRIHGFSKLVASSCKHSHIAFFN